MSKRTPVVNMAGDWEESVVQLSRHLGTSKIRRQIFNVVYGRGTRPKSKKQIMECADLSAGMAQQVQNELDHLSRHGLIVKIENDGSVKDGSRYLYCKDLQIRANKDAIVSRADNKRLADSTPTKRRPAAFKTLRPLIVERKALKKRKKIVVLYLTASPDPDNPLRVDVEVKMVQGAIRGSLFRDKIDVQFRPAADLGAILDGLNDHKPQLVHYSGHSDSDGIETDNGRIVGSAGEELSYELLAKALAATDEPPQVVVLNSCDSSAARKALLKAVPILISMRTSVSDIAATAFSSRFYAAVASGLSIKAAFEQGVIAVQATSITEKDTPELFAQAGVNPAKLVLS